MLKGNPGSDDVLGVKMQNFIADKVQLHFWGGLTAVTSELHCRQSSTSLPGGGQLQSVQNLTTHKVQLHFWGGCPEDVGHFLPFVLNYLCQVSETFRNSIHNKQRIKC